MYFSNKMLYNDKEVISLENNNYKMRLIDKKIEKYLKIFGAVCIEGPKWCGKTWTSRYHSNSEFLVGDPNNNFQNRQIAQLDVNTILIGEKPRLIDEWNEVPEIWDAVRYKCDEDGKKGKYILTGSSTPNHKGIMHSGAGRIGKIKMLPMSLYESGNSTGDISLEEICNGKITNKITKNTSLKDLIGYILRGGWPGSIDLSIEQAIEIPKQYVEEIIDDDSYRIDNVKRDTIKMKLLLKTLARNESTTVSNNKLKEDIKDKESNNIDDKTLSDYLNIFEKLYLLSNQKPYSPKVRSSLRIKQSEKRHFVDPSIATSLLNLNEKKLMNDLETLGFLFEAMVERDLRIYADTFGAELYHYQDYNNNEIDAIIEMSDGEYAAIEIKLGAKQIDEAANNLIKIKNKMIEDGTTPPKTLIVVCGLTNAAYQREDGVIVVPITALKN